ncbi:FecR family protein [Spirosoma daeguense]
MKPVLTKKIIFDYIDGKATSIQRKFIEEWLEDSKNKELYFQYLDEWEQNHPQYIFNIEDGLEKVYKNIENPSNEIKESELNSKRNNLFFYLQWAAAAAIFLTFAWLGWSRFNKPSFVTYGELVKNTKAQTGEIYEKENLTAKPILINLPDKSSVILQPKSKICYSPKSYNKTKREIILAGEAFFEVQKNSKIPFFVYANELITKVLGTSFSIKTQPAKSEIEVVVKTGKVAVFLQYDRKKNQKLESNTLDGYILKPNEKVKINRNNYKIDKPTHVDQSKLTLPIQRLSFNFDDTPAIDVFKDLEKAYNIQIVYNKEKLAHCKLTAHLSDEPLAEKIELICTALEATYRKTDNQITLISNGCR